MFAHPLIEFSGEAASDMKHAAISLLKKPGTLAGNSVFSSATCVQDRSRLLFQHAAIPTALGLEVSQVEGAEHVDDQHGQQPERRDGDRMVSVHVV